MYFLIVKNILQKKKNKKKTNLLYKQNQITLQLTPDMKRKKQLKLKMLFKGKIFQNKLRTNEEKKTCEEIKLNFYKN